MIRRAFRRLLNGPEPDDIIPTDWVVKKGERRKGVVQSILNNHALVDWLDGSKEIVAFAMLKRVRPSGEEHDRRSK